MDNQYVAASWYGVVAVLTSLVLYHLVLGGITPRRIVMALAFGVGMAIATLLTAD